MLPACTTELEIPRLATLVAPFALGILFVGTHNSHVAKVLLGEISKKYSPLSIFGGGNGNSTSANVNQPENNHSAADREAHSLCSGLYTIHFKKNNRNWISCSRNVSNKFRVWVGFRKLGQRQRRKLMPWRRWI